MTQNILKDWALAYAEAGFSVLPCNGKIPLTQNGCSDATTDKHTIERYWPQYSTANIGLRCDDIFVQDFDVKHDFDEHGRFAGVLADGIGFRQRLSIELGPLPLGPLAASGGGLGEHCCFAVPNVRILGQTNVGGFGIDIRTENQYIIVEPSVHPKTGNIYKWIRPLIVHQNGHWVKATLPHLPQRWIDWLVENTKPRKPQLEVVRPDFQAVADRIIGDLKACGRCPERITLGSFATVKAKAAGKWMAIAEYLCPGITSVTDSSNRWHTCPLCQKPAKFRLFDDFNKSGTCICYFCHPQGGDGIATVAWLFDIEPSRAATMIDYLLHTGRF